MLTSGKLNEMYRLLEDKDHRNHKGELDGKPLSARTVRYVHTIIRAALQAAVEGEPPLLGKNVADKAKPPSAKEAKAPEMHRDSWPRSWRGRRATASCTQPGGSWP
uniref:Uncharacterized protein n=1 Tax=Nonomuraea gerenzanensis TaxID=93944 RepID=A0A1M4EFH4_9ACTN|nr:hypothetical protein BN4615_P7076 [Nonomuraea gerenzanensis]